MKTILTPHYPIYINEVFAELQKFIDSRNYSKVFFLVDANTSERCLPVVTASLPTLTKYDIVEIDPGEENKNIDICIGIWKTLIDFEADRDALLVNLGGGMVSDIGGFAASTYKRGIDFVNVPTTLLAQVDASVGGKTGIDIDRLKNIIGTFAEPKAVFVDPVFLGSLSDRELLAGFAEAVKHGLIADADYFSRMEEIANVSTELKDVLHHASAIISRSIEIKNQIVTYDPYEKGRRKLLNFGHTVGHALEAFSLAKDKNPMTHGEAVAFGMIAESYLSHEKNNLSPNELIAIEELITLLYPAYDLKERDFEKVLDLMKHDKKNKGGEISFTLLTKIGEATWDNFCSDSEILNSLAYTRKVLHHKIFKTE